MARRRKTEVGIEVGIAVKAPPLTDKEKQRLTRDVKSVLSVLDAHDLDTVTLPGDYRISTKRARK